MHLAQRGALFKLSLNGGCGVSIHHPLHNAIPKKHKYSFIWTSKNIKRSNLFAPSLPGFTPSVLSCYHKEITESRTGIRGLMMLEQGIASWILNFPVGLYVPNAWRSKDINLPDPARELGFFPILDQILEVLKKFKIVLLLFYNMLLSGMIHIELTWLPSPWNLAPSTPGFLGSRML